MLAAAFAVVVLAALLGAPGRTLAANSISSCTVSSTGLTFANYDLLGRAQVTGSGTLVVQCTGKGNDTVNVALSTGSGTCTTRTVKSGANSMNYNVYTTSALSTVWCDPTTRVPVSFSLGQGGGSTATQNVTFYGAVASGQSVPPGTYTDTLQATVFWTGGNSPASNVAIQEGAPAACSASAATLAFGAYTGAIINAQATFTASCSLSSPYTVALGGGSNQTGSQRRMSATGGYFIPYSLYSDSTRTTAWGDGTGLGATVAGTGTGSAQNFNVYGATGAQSSPHTGSYSDLVVVTVSY
jgi:spore coat protein U-like protein